MPVYEYACEKCGQIKEVVQKITDPPLNSCDFCRGRLKKLISQSTFQLKGTGWYVTDYASKSRSAQSASEKGKGSEKGKEPQVSEKAPEKKADE